MNPVTWDETNGYEATRIYRENAVAAVLPSCGRKMERAWQD